MAIPEYIKNIGFGATTEMAEFLDSQPNRSEFIRELIRQKMEPTSVNGETHLPDKDSWACTLDSVRKANKIEKRILSKLAEMSRPTLNRVLKGKGTHDQLKAVEDGIREAINAKD